MRNQTNLLVEIKWLSLVVLLPVVVECARILTKGMLKRW